MYLAGPRLFTFWGIICGIVMLAPGHRNSVCMLEIMFMQISALYVSMVRDSDVSSVQTHQIPLNACVLKEFKRDWKFYF